MLDAYQFAELHCLSHYSFLSAASSPQEMVQQAHALGYQAIAITDECSVAGVVKAWKQTQSTPIQLIVGSYFNDQDDTFTLLATNQHGYEQLSALITHCRQRAPKGQYQFSSADLLHHDLSDCVLLYCPLGSWRSPNTELMLQLAQRFNQRTFLLIKRDLLPADKAFVQALCKLSEQCGLPIVASNMARMHHAQRLPLLHTVLSIRAGQTVAQQQAHLPCNAEQRLRTLAELQQLFQPAWLKRSVAIAKQCQFVLDSLQYQYPSEVVPQGYQPHEYLAEQAWLGAKRRFQQQVPPAIAHQLVNELSLVHDLQYEHFFLTIYDVIEFARQQQILFQGRGSAANSVLCYCLGITAVNPAQSQLLFERFISKERDEPPDIDVDFEHQRREEVIQYIYQKYGRQRAALTATVITYRLRSALKDVGKALGFPLIQLNQLLARLDRRDSEDDWQQQLEAMGVLQHPLGMHLLQLTAQLKGFPRHLSQHVGGFVIAKGALSNLVPIENAAMPERTVIQWDKNDIETLKLLKVDVLGLGMLTALRRSLDIVAQRSGQQLGLADIPQEDPSVYTMLCKADAVGVFQVESRAQMNMLPRLKPKTFYDLVVQIAIVRPGPIQGDMVHPYLRRRDGLEPVTYPNAAVQDVLQRTLGVPIFQEQVIKLAMVAAGFSGGEADQLRRAMATWKSKGQMLEFKRKIVEGMLLRGYEEQFALRLFEQILGFGEYGFPESHAASFANLAYASAWLKCHYPAAFYVGLLNSLPMGFYSADQLVQDARQHQVEVLPICINQSSWLHQVVYPNGKACIQLGLLLVKGLSQSVADDLLAARPISGFESIQQVQQLQLPTLDMEALASAGAFARLSGHRYQTRWQMTRLGDQLDMLQHAEEGQADYQLPAPDALSDMVQDYASLGLTLAAHPLALLAASAPQLPNYKRAAQLKNLRSGQLVTVLGLVVGRQRPSTSAGVTFVTLEDETGNVNVVVWRDLGRTQRKQWLNAKLLEVKGRIEIEGEVIHVIAGRMTDRSDLLPTRAVRSRDFH
ncbi:error-prone DNA polymerase [Aliidiomarina maris]|uniref:Error-prone DNA polymerase n=1 Tax=Aliidiomarina maris TaxID=531312 RepID=A0A327WPC4_9GAMM|nr:DNA polymerase III alpha subunit [Aliidiomarina maris]